MRGPTFFISTSVQLVSSPSRAGSDAINPVARIILHERVVAAEIVRIKFRRHLTAATPAFVADADERNLPRLGPPVFPAQIAHHRIGRGGHVFNPFGQFLDRAAADVAADVGRGADLIAEIQKLVRAELVVLHHAAPGRVDSLWTLIARADAVLPMILIRETAARPADDGNFNFFQRGDDVIANPARVRNGTVLANPDAIVNATAQVLGKLPVNVPADGVLALIGVDD